MDNDQVAALADQFEGRASVSSSPRGGRGGSRGGRFRSRGGGGASGSGSKGREVDISRALSRLLRHQAQNAGVRLDGQGYASLERVLQWPPLRSLSPTMDEIVSLVHNSDKQRFALKPATEGGDETSTDPKDWLVRANQGHSIKLENEGLLKPLALPDADGTVPEGSVKVPETVVHGTYFAFWKGIVQSGGLKAMGRNHVHCSTGLPDDEKGVISGMRKDAELLVYVDAEKSMRDGVKWWISDNGVVLTEGAEEEGGLVSTKYFKEVVGRTQGVGTLWRDGEWVADLPDGIKIRVPQGKNRAGGGGGGRGGRGRA
ncbi:hypothetical protein OQA88_246 [Cercophora sp. LCS_1]